MTLEVNKDIVPRFYDLVWIKRDMAQAGRLIHPQCRRHDPSGPVPAGPDGFAAMAERFRSAFSEFALAIDIMLAEADLVATRWTITAKHTGAFADVPATSRSIRFSGVNIFRIENGQVAEIWNHRDDLSLWQQIGAVPSPARR